MIHYTKYREAQLRFAVQECDTRMLNSTTTAKAQKKLCKMQRDINQLHPPDYFSQAVLQ